MSKTLKAVIILFLTFFLISGILMIVLDAKPELKLSKALEDFKPLIVGSHLACWMILGMISNYLWDLFNAGKTIKDIWLPDLLLPLLVSPIVFFGIWSLWLDKNAIAFATNLIAFQNGFFWQVILSKEKGQFVKKTETTETSS